MRGTAAQESSPHPKGGPGSPSQSGAGQMPAEAAAGRRAVGGRLFPETQAREEGDPDARR